MGTEKIIIEIPVMVEGCLKIGCHQHKLKLVDIDEQLGMIHGHDEIQLPM